MRNASQLYRGLAEATRSLERPYIPRHVPLPSSSFSANTQSSATAHPPDSSAFGGDFTRAAEDRSNQELCHSRRTTDSPQPNSLQNLPPAATRPRRKRVEQAAFDPSQVQQKHTTPPTVPIDHPSMPLQRQGFVPRIGQQTDQGCWAQSGPPRDAQSKLTSEIIASQTNLSHAKPVRALAKRVKAKDTASPSNLKAVATVYPHLTEPQVDLLLQTFGQIKSLRSHAPSAVVAWYDDFVWTSERESSETQQIETAESLSLLLRYVYQRNDLRSLIHIESRAMRTTKLARQSDTSITMPAQMPKQLADVGTHGISIWPDPGENPSVLAYNLKVAFAAREGNWVQVDELLNDARLATTSSTKATRGSASSTRSASVLNSIGWRSLLRFGLGNVPKLQSDDAQTSMDPAASREVRQAAVIGSEASNNSASSPLADFGADRMRKALENEAQLQAKLAVTKRLLPALLRYTSRSSSVTRSNNATASIDALEPKTPAWLLQSVLTQLAERGETASIIRIVQLAVLEDSAAIYCSSARSGGQATHTLNLVLTACVRNHKVNLAETLRIFNSLTKSRLGESVVGSAVLTGPTIIGIDQRGLQPRPQASAGKLAESNLQPSGDESVKQRGMAPNEESLILVLKKVRHPLFRAAWTRKLVEEFEQLFPRVKLSGRTFRLIIDKCVTPAAPSSANEPEALFPSEPTAASESRERIVASGRRGRRLRQEATRPSPSTGAAPTLAVASAGRGPIVKQAILLHSLEDILRRFRSHSSPGFHRSTTNRRRFEHTLLRAKRTLQAKRAFHQDQLDSTPEPGRTGLVTHHTRAISQIDTLLDRLAQVQRLGRAEESHRKKA